MQIARPGQRRGPRRTYRFAVALVLVACLLALAGPVLAQPAAPDTLHYRVRGGDTLLKICSRFRAQTHHYSLDDLLTDIRQTNDLSSNLLRIGQPLAIPVMAEKVGPQVAQRVRDGAELRAIYLTGPACGVSSVFSRVDRFITAGGNAVVFDAKDIDGGVSFYSHHPLAKWGHNRSAPVISSLTDMMERFDQRGLYSVARIALFLDGELGRERPDLALQDSTGAVWGERNCVWMDPSAPEVIDYNLTLAAELARAGIDEIQFDYVRFPTNGWQGDWQGDLEQTALRRRRIIGNFLAAAQDTLAQYGVKISVDLYGIMAWGRVADLALTGQHVPTIAAHVDVICPMIYPSHFGPGFDGRKRPADEPEYFIGEGTRRFVALAAGQAEIRPWLQAFPYRVTNYDGQYVARQVVTARAAGGQGWMLWNPSCRYTVALTAMAGLCGPAAVTPTAIAALPAEAPDTAGAAPGSLPGAVMPQVAIRAALLPLQASEIQ